MNKVQQNEILHVSSTNIMTAHYQLLRVTRSAVKTCAELPSFHRNKHAKMCTSPTSLHFDMHLCVCLFFPRCMPTLLQRPGCNLGEW